MTEIVAEILRSAAGGVILGLLYFGGLWWTVQRLPVARSPALLAAGSFFFRSLLVSAGLVIVSAGEPVPLLAAVAGFLVARGVSVRISRGRPSGARS